MRRRDGLQVAVMVVLATVVAGCAGDAAQRAEPRPAALITDEAPPTAPDPDPPPEPQSRAWRLFAVGDVKLDRTEERGVDPFAHVHPPLSAAHVAIVNAEMTIATGGQPAEKEFVFRAPPAAASRMAAAGIDVASLANNHALDYGVDALLESVVHLRAAGVGAVGAGEDADSAYAPWSAEPVPGVRLAVIGASYVLGSPREAAGLGPGLASAYDRRRLLAAVRSAAADHDVVVVTVHWGVEREACPEARQRDLGAALVAAGATVVLGHHPHVLQPIEAGDGTLVAYSLGNFVFDYRTGPAGNTVVLDLEFDGTVLKGHTAHPHTLATGIPRPATTAERNGILASLAGECPPRR